MFASSQTHCSQAVVRVRRQTMTVRVTMRLVVDLLSEQAASLQYDLTATACRLHADLRLDVQPIKQLTIHSLDQQR